MRHRAELPPAVPDLRAATLDQLAEAIQQLAAVVAERAGTRSDSSSASTLAGAMLGVMIAAELYWAEHPGTELLALLDEALAKLNAGLSL